MGVKRSLKIGLITLLLALSLPTDSYALTLQEAARQAARQYDAKVLSARTITQGNRRIYEIRLLTKDGVVKTVRIPDPTPRK